MADDSKKQPSEEDLLEDLNLDDEELDLDDLKVDSEKSLPKKVELDIDDLALEDEGEEEEAPAPPPKEPPPEEIPEIDEEEEEAPKPKRRIAKKKLLILAGVALVVILALGVGAFIFLSPTEPPAPPPAPPAPPQVSLAPFIIDFPFQEPGRVYEVLLVARFPNPAVKQEFETNILSIRDLIYRYVQGQGPEALKDPKTYNDLSMALTGLINRALKLGQVDKVVVKAVNSV